MRPTFQRWGLVLTGLVSFYSGHGQLLRNSVPIILTQKPLQTESGRPITIQLTDLVVVDLDDPYPYGFKLTVYEGKSYLFEGTTVTPDDDYSGNLKVQVSVNDGESESKKYDLRITVYEPDNVHPVVTGQVPLRVEENSSLTISLAHLIVTDPDNDYPEDFTLVVYSGANYVVSGHTITPDQGFTGTIHPEVRVDDGEDESNRFTMEIEVFPENVAPTITGQTALSTEENTSLTLRLDHLKVTDPDNDYPEGFTLTVYSGANYKVSGHTITPDAGFEGAIHPEVSVHDGEDESSRYTLDVEVFPANVPPVITGQVALSMDENTSLILKLEHLKVTDPDNTYPDDFTLRVYPGSNYQVSGTTITPARDFSGNITPEVTVKDGRANSNRFKLQIKVVPENMPPVITGQVPLAFNEDGSIQVKLTHLIVSDPDDTYPGDFTLEVLPGTGYSVNGHTVKPSPNYHGALSVPVTVNDGKDTSKPYTLSIIVQPVNDAPQVLGLETRPLAVMVGKGPAVISESVDVKDVDNDNMTVAEVSFDDSSYRPGIDRLQYDNKDTPGINGVFDPTRGALFLIGTALSETYAKALRNVSYEFIVGEDDIVFDSTKTIYVKVNDGLLDSQPASREIELIKGIVLNIPQWFTPNGDASNDTWRVQSINSSDDYSDALIRVYTIRGTVVYEATGLDTEWDGRHRGDVLPTDTYYYTIDLNLPYTNATYKGMVTILR